MLHFLPVSRNEFLLSSFWMQDENLHPAYVQKIHISHKI